MDLSGKIAIVLGAAGAGNMGQAIAKRFAAEGAKVVVAGRHETPLKSLASEIGGSYFISDITQKADLENLVRHTVKTYGGCDVGVNAVGLNLLTPSLDVTEEELDTISSIHFKGAYFFVQAVGGYMKDNGGGSLIQVSSATVEAIIENHAAYIATKAASESLMRCFAVELGPFGVKLNTVSPGYTKTPMTTEFGAIPGLEDAFVARYPLGRVGTSEDIADAAVWLAQDGSFISGQTLQINGGLTLRGNPTGADVNASVAAAAQT